MRILSLSLLLTACRAEIKTPTTDTEDVIVTEADLDGDGYLEGDDCDDNDASIYPGATETCDGIDNDCDGNVDEEVTDTFYVDADGDGFGDPDNTVEGCDAPLGSVPNGNDCDDSEPTVFPSNTEVCDGLDNDCNGTIDEDIPSVWYLDADGDGYGDSTQMAETCLPEAGYIAENGDCDDSDPAVFPNAEEVCDSIDNNCDGDIDEGLLTLFYVDADLDGYGDNITLEACEMTEGLSLTGGDCDDADSQSNPGEDEVCGDSIDNNCNGVSDEPSAVNATVWYLDNDGDGYGVDAQSQTACDQPTGYSANSGDCDDTNTSIYTGAPELCDGIINDCTTNTLPSTETDDDGDGYVDCSIDSNGWNGTSTVVGGDDCNDNNANHHQELTWYYDNDNDGFGDVSTGFTICVPPLNGYVNDGTDCDDDDANTYPSALEICDGIVNACGGSLPSTETDDDGDGYVECSIDTNGWNGAATVVGGDDCNDNNTNHHQEQTWYYDNDGDGYGSTTTGFTFCEPPNNYVLIDGDCDNNDSTTYVGAPELCDGIVNACGGSLPSDEMDDDGDGYVECSIDTNGWNGIATVVGGDDCNDNNVNHHQELTWYYDNDNDGFGDVSTGFTICVPPPNGYVTDGTDCDDDNEDSYPSAPEVCDGFINNCTNSTLPLVEIDNDGDGYVECSITTNTWNGSLGILGGDDCNDSNDTIYPTADDVCDGVDNDCNGSIDDDIAFFGLDASCAADNCLDIITQYADAEDGVYWVNPDGNGAHEVYCDMTTDNGGWSLISVVRSDDASQVIVANSYCASIDPATNCKGKMPTSEANFADEILVYDLGSDEFIVYEGFETNGAFGYFTLNKQLAYDSTCTGYNHICGSAIDPNLSIARTSGYTYNYSGPLYQWWRLGGWWIGANPNSGNAIGRVHASSYSSSHDLRNRASSGSSTGQVSAGHQALYYR